MILVQRLAVAAGVLVLVLLAGPFAMVATGTASIDGDWRTASHDVVGLAPDPAATPEALVQVYAARAFAWRGAFGLHSWIAVKPENAAVFTTYEVIGWRHYRGLPAVAVRERRPDTEWFGSAPVILAELRGPAAAAAIPGIERAVADYPFDGEYRVWPGPNSNTFTAHIARRVPALRLDLPPTAVGKDYLAGGVVLARAPSGTGWQVSLGGLFGVLAAVEEGLEVNLLGLSLGVDPLDLSLRLPGLGRIGFGGAS